MKKIGLGINLYKIAFRILAVVSVLLTHVSVFAGKYGGGDGTADNPYIIKTVDHVIELSNEESFGYYYYRLDADIDMKDVGFKKIGGESGFVGDFNGNNHKISNVVLEDSADYVGFFSKVSNSSIYDIRFENVDIKGRSYVGGVAGSISNTNLRNILVSGSVAASWSVVGGISGFVGNSVNIVNVQNYAYVYAEYLGVYGIPCTGGVFGYCNGSIVYYALNVGNVVAEGKNVGGVIGYADNMSDICFSVNIGDVYGMTECIGGVVGCSYDGGVIECINTGTVKANSNKVSYLGGVCGYLYGYRIAYCLNSGLVKGTENSSYVGGCVGVFLPNYNGLETSINAGVFFAVGDNLGIVAGGRNRADKSISYYDKTLSNIGDEEAVGLTLDSLRLLINNFEIKKEWTQLDTFLYPVPNMSSGSTVYETPDDFNEILYFASLPVPFDSVSADKQLMSQFELYPVDGISYTSSTGCLQIKGHNVGLAKIGTDTLFINYKNSRRVIPVCVGTVDTLLFSGGKGTKVKPYVLTTIDDVRKLAEMVNEEVSYDDANKNWSYGKYFYLANDINENVDFVVGNCAKGDEYSFQGYFDGGGHYLSLDIDSTVSAALFGVVGSGAEIKSLSVVGRVSGGDYTSGICGVLKGGTLRGCYNGAEIVGANVVGGVCALAEDGSIIIGCANSGTVKGLDTVGGLAGSVKGVMTIVDRCLNSGYVEGVNVAGGVTGLIEDAALSASVGVGAVKGSLAGAVCGANSGVVTSLFFDSRMLSVGDEFAVGIETDSLLNDKILNRFETDSSMWIFEDGYYALPVELSGVKDAKLAGYCFPINSKDCVSNVSFDFSVPTKDLALSWKSLGGNVNFADGMAYLTKWGADTLQMSLSDKQVRECPVFLTYPIFSGGRGTAEEPYIIEVYDDMKFLEELVNTNKFANSSAENWSKDKYFKVVADITDTIKFVIGDGRDESAYFGGVFDGAGHEFILNIDSLNKGKSNKPVGLFGTVKNGKMDAVRVCGYVKGKDCVGGVCGYSYNSQINASVNSASVLGGAYVGGICGLAKGNYDKSKTANLSSVLNIGYIAGDSCVGGIVGKTDSCGVKMLVNTGVVSAELDLVGGIAGLALGGVNASRYDRVLNFSSFKVAKENEFYGAICGKFDGRMISGYYDKQMSLELLGGISGKDYDNVDNIHAVGISTEVLTDGSLFSDVFFPIDMTHREGFYPCPTAIDSFLETKLAVTPVNLKNDEFIGLIKSDFSVPDSLGVSFTSLHNCFTTNAINASLRKPGDDVVCLRLGKYVKNLNAFIVNGLFSGGNGTEDCPYLIKTKKDMEDLASMVNQNTLQTVYGRNWSYGNFFSLQNDILEDTIRTIVGENAGGSELICFEGVFYGNGYSINVEIERDTNNVGVFGVVGYGTIDSLIVNGEVSGSYFVGGICGLNRDGKIKGCVNNARVSGKVYVGGVLGFNRGEISYSGNSGRVCVETEYAGGISGVNVNNAKITHSVNAGTIWSDGNAIGGIVGNNAGFVSDCFNSGFVSQGTKVGGICGEVFGDESCLIKNCLNAGVVYSSKQTGQIGSIYGYFNSSGLVEDCYSDSQICEVKADEVGFSTKELLTFDKFESWLRTDSLYPRPFDSELAFLAASPVFFDENDKSNSVDSTFYLSKTDSLKWESAVGRFNVSGEKARLLRKGSDTVKVMLKGMLREMPIEINCLTSYDTLNQIGCDSFFYQKEDGTELRIFSDTSFVDTLNNDGCDSLLTVDVKISKVSFADSVINGCEKIEFDGVVYTDSILVKDTLMSSVGCDSVVSFVYLNVYKTNRDSLLVIQGCDSVIYEGVVYYETTALSDTVKSNVCDCDSVIFGVGIVVNKTIIDSLDVHGCGVVEYGGVMFYSDTSFVDTFKALSGCDSMVYVNVMVGEETRFSVYKSACDSLFFVNSEGLKVKYTESVSFNDTLVNSRGCDSILTVNVNILKSDYVVDTFYGCDKFRYVDKVVQRSEQGVVSVIDKDEYIIKDTLIRYELKNENFCDSIREIHIKITKPSYHEYNIRGCDSVVLNDGQVFYRDTTYEERYDCDSIRNVKVQVFHPVYESFDMFGCESVYFEGVTYYKDTILNRVYPPADKRCDTFRTIKIKVADPIRVDTLIVGCGFVDYDGRLFESDDELTKVYKSFLGCDSLIRTITIKIVNEKEGSEIIENCDSVYYNGQYFKENTILEEVHKSVEGCDSVVKIHLNVIKPIEESRVVSGCDSLSYNGKVYFNDTTLVEHYLSVKGCDSIVNVNIKIGYSEEHFVKLASCGRVRFDDEYFYADTSFARVYANESGCDSVVNVDIDVWDVSFTEIVVDSMTQVTYGGKVYYRSTVLRDTLTNNLGCDSFVTVFINVEKSLGVPLIVNKHDYVLFCNNNIFDEKFVAYQWYKDGVPVAGATKDYYTEEVLLNGCFQVYVTTNEGKEYASETICFEKGRELNLYPNPVAVGENVVVDYEFTEEQKFNLLIEVFNSKGICVYRGEPSSYPIEIPGRAEPGYYYMLITTGKGDSLGERFIVK